MFMPVRFLRFLFLLLCLGLTQITCITSLALSPVQVEIFLDQNQLAILHDFSLSLKKEDYLEEVQFYNYVATQETITAQAVLVRDGHQIYLTVPASLVSLSQDYRLIVTDIYGTAFEFKNLTPYKKNDLFWTFHVNIPSRVLENVYFTNVREIREDSTSWLFSINILTPPQNLDFFTPSQVVRRYDLQGSIVLNKDLRPIGFLAYTHGQISVFSLKNFLTLLEETPVIRYEPSLSGLTLAAQNFAQLIETENLPTAKEFFSSNLTYRFGHAAYLFLRSNSRMKGLLTRNDIRRGGLYPLQKALIIFFNENIQKNDGGLKFRIVVSLADNPLINSSIVTFSLNRSIASTAWRWSENRWTLESLPLSVENQLVPFLALGKQGVLSPPPKPFSGFAFAAGVGFYPGFQPISPSITYNLNLSRHLSVDFKVSYDILPYSNSYNLAGGHLGGRTTAEFISAKIGLRLQYPFVILHKVYLMPYAGIEMGSAFLLTRTASSHMYFNDLVISRIPITLLIGWQAGLEFGVRAGIPMALGMGVGYQQDFFGQQTVKQGPTGSTNPQGMAEMYYISLYYKFAVPF